jgi:hypothetical protein
MAATSTTETWDAAWTLTMRAKKKRLTDNISDSYPTIDRFRKAGVLETESGGKEIQEDLMYALGSSEWFDGFDVLSTAATDGITAAFYTFAYNATPIVISMTEEKESRKSDSAVKLLTAKTQQAMTKSMDTINSALHVSAGGKAMLSLQDIVPQAAGSTLGGINATNETWWENQRKDFNASFSGNFSTQTLTRHHGIIAMGQVWNDSSEGNDKTNLIATSFTNMQLYEEMFEASDSFTRFTTSGSKRSGGGDLGITGDLTFRGAPIYADRDCVADDMYFLNTKYLKLKMQAGLNFAKTPFKEPANQMAKVAFVVTGVQLVTNNRRRQGVLYDIA